MTVRGWSPFRFGALVPGTLHRHPLIGPPPSGQLQLGVLVVMDSCIAHNIDADGRPPTLAPVRSSHHSFRSQVSCWPWTQFRAASDRVLCSRSSSTSGGVHATTMFVKKIVVHDIARLGCKFADDRCALGARAHSSRRGTRHGGASLWRLPSHA